MKHQFINKRFNASSLSLIFKAEEILDDYANQGYTLTLRQLYYQFVARDIVPNSHKSYKRVGNIINEARLAGLIDWNYMTDRSRSLKGVSTWDNPASILSSALYSYKEDKWETQHTRPEVWVEKEALIEVVGKACTPHQVDYFACKGYASASAFWDARNRMVSRDQTTMVIYLGDHDPSGLDMPRDIEARLTLMMEGRPFYFKHIALNMEQVEKFNPPPNPAKLTDSRCEGYIREYGHSSWELDALEPSYIDQIIQDTIIGERDDDLWDEACLKEDESKERLGKYVEMEDE